MPLFSALSIRSRRAPSAAIVFASAVLLGLIGPRGAIAQPPPPVRGEAANQVPGLDDPPLPILKTPLGQPPVKTTVDGLGKTTGAIEVKLGQGRFLILDEDLAKAPAAPVAVPPPAALIPNPAPGDVVPGRLESFLAIGDPAVADFSQVGPRQIRLTGKKIGTTDLTITTSQASIYSFEIRVVPDLDPLRIQLFNSFRNDSITVRPLREAIVVEGQADSLVEKTKILEMVEIYAQSIQKSQEDAQKKEEKAAQNTSPTTNQANADNQASRSIPTAPAAIAVNNSDTNKNNEKQAQKTTLVIDLIGLPPTPSRPPKQVDTDPLRLVPLQKLVAELFPDASVTLRRVQQKVIVEGQARDALQVKQILEVVKAHVQSIQPPANGNQGVGEERVDQDVNVNLIQPGALGGVGGYGSAGAGGSEPGRRVSRGRLWRWLGRRVGGAGRGCPGV